MNIYGRPALRSVIVLAILAGMYVASFWMEGSNSAGIPYVSHSGVVKKNGQSETTTGYFVVTIRRSGQPPWLVVAKPLSSVPNGVEIGMTSKPASVTADGIEYRELSNQTIVVLNSGGNVSVQHLSTTGNAISESLSQGLNEISVSDLELLFLKAH